MAALFLVSIATTYAGGTSTTTTRTVQLNGGLYTVTAPAALTGSAQYSQDAFGNTRLTVIYPNISQLPAGTVLDVIVDGVKVGTLTTTAAGGTLTLTVVPKVTSQSRVSVTLNGTTYATAVFTRAS